MALNGLREIQADYQSRQQGRHPYAGANVKFFNEIVENRTKTAKEGRPIYDEIPSVSIQWPGMDETVVQITDEHKRTFPDLYRAWLEGQEPPTSGLPLKEWAMIPASVVKELTHLGFKTVEQLGEANDAQKARLGTAQKYVKMAANWLASTKDPQNEVVALRQQLERLETRNKKQEEQIALLQMRVESNEGTKLRDKNEPIGSGD